MRAWIAQRFASLEETPLSLGGFVVAFSALIAARVAIEGAVLGFEQQNVRFLFFECSHFFLFFLLAYALFWPMLGWFAGIGPRPAAVMLLFGFLVILTPPLIDKAVFGDQAFWSFYAFDGLSGLFFRYLTLFGDNPQIGITYGVRAEVALVTLAVGCYTWAKTGKIMRAAGAALASYTLLFVLGTFPSWLTLLFAGWEKGFLEIGRTDVAAWFLAPEPILGREDGQLRSVLNHKMSLAYALLLSFSASWLLWKRRPSHFRALWENARFPQLVYHGGLLLTGMALALLYSGTAFTPGIFDGMALLAAIGAVSLAWLGSVVTNDLADVETDRLTNAFRPLVKNAISRKDYSVYGLLFFAGSLLLGALVNFSLFFLLLAYQAMAYLYSAFPFRLKRFPGIATLLAAFAGLLILFGGYITLSPTGDLSLLPPSLILFLLVSYAAIVPIKDFKDIAGDRAEGVYTIPVLLGEQKARLLLGALLFLVFVASPMIMRFPALVFPALLFGSAAFWVIQKSRPEEAAALSYRRLPFWILSLVFGYGLIVAFLLTRTLA